MTPEIAVSRFAALSQPTRLIILQRLMRAGVGGLPAGVLGEQLGVAASTLSFHLKELTTAGLTTSRREGRHIIYTAAFNAVDELVGYLIDSCCADGQSDGCALPAATTKQRAS